MGAIRFEYAMFRIRTNLKIWIWETKGTEEVECDFGEEKKPESWESICWLGKKFNDQKKGIYAPILLKLNHLSNDLAQAKMMTTIALRDSA